MNLKAGAFVYSSTKISGDGGPSQQTKARPVSECIVVNPSDENLNQSSAPSSRSHSVSRPTAPKLARFRSFQDLANHRTTKQVGGGGGDEDELRLKGESRGISSLKSSRIHIAPPLAFQRFKERFAKGAAATSQSGDGGSTPMPSSRRQRLSKRTDEAGDASSDSESLIVATQSSRRSSQLSKKPSKVGSFSFCQSSDNS